MRTYLCKNRVLPKVNKFILFVFLLINIAFIHVGIAQTRVAEDLSSNNQTSTLESELEELKSQVLQLNRELFILEEDILFPASTQIAIFVSVDIGKFFKIDSVEVKINDESVAGFLYTKRQRQALEQGGIQKLYLGNLKTGNHHLTAIFNGLDNDGRAVKRAINYEFEKDDGSLMLELKVMDETSNLRAKVVVEEWVL